jgi:hypothetical protein
MQSHHWLGLFALFTLVLAGAATDRILKLPNGTGIYLMLLAVAIIGWWIGRRSNCKQERS